MLTCPFQGQNGDYDDLISSLKASSNNPEAPTSQRLRQLIVGLTRNISLLNPSYDQLVKAVLDIDWITINEDIVHSYVFFLRNLISTHSCYAIQTLLMLVKQ